MGVVSRVEKHLEPELQSPRDAARGNRGQESQCTF